MTARPLFHPEDFSNCSGANADSIRRFSFGFPHPGSSAPRPLKLRSGALHNGLSGANKRSGRRLKTESGMPLAHATGLAAVELRQRQWCAEELHSVTGRGRGAWLNKPILSLNSSSVFERRSHAGGRKGQDLGPGRVHTPPPACVPACLSSKGTLAKVPCLIIVASDEWNGKKTCIKKATS